MSLEISTFVWRNNCTVCKQTASHHYELGCVFLVCWAFCMHSCIGCSCGTWDVFPNDLFALPWSSLAGDCFSSNVVSLGKFKGQLKAKEQMKESVESESFSTFDCIVHSPLGIIYWLSCGTFHSGISLPLSNMRHIFGHSFFQSLHEVSAYIVQGGRSCAKAQRALAEKFGLGQKFKS